MSVLREHSCALHHVWDVLHGREPVLVEMWVGHLGGASIDVYGKPATVDDEASSGGDITLRD